MTGNSRSDVEARPELRLAPVALRQSQDGVSVTVETTDDVLEVIHHVSLPDAITAPRTFYVRFAKPAMDFVGALILMVLTLPILLAAMAAIALTMSRPVIFRQERVGLNGRHFTVYKLRTMRDDPSYLAKTLRPDADGRINHKVADDPRITPLGRLLRKLNIDELPQLWNVLKGDMSLVGPRPELVQIVDQYEPWQHGRHIVKPGITGLWQVTARDAGPMHEATHIDLNYVRKVSVVLDVRLLVGTLTTAFGSQRGM